MSGKVLAGAVVGAVAGFAACWVAVVRDHDLAREQSVAAERATAEKLASAADAASKHETRASEAERKLRDASAALAAVQERLAAADAKLRDLESAAKPGPAPKPDGAKEARNPQAFSFPDRDEILGQVDWRIVGTSLAKMGPLCAKFAEELAKGGELPPEVVGELQRHNGPLVTQALRVMGKVPGTGANGAFTHPVFSVNALAAALDALGMPLTESQSASLLGIARRYAAEDAQRLAGYDERTFQLRKLVEEGSIRSRFLADALGALTNEQRDALRPAATRDRTSLDLWSSGIFWSQFARPVRLADREKLQSEFCRSLVTGLKLDEAGQARAEAVRASWAAALPADTLKRAEDPLSAMNMFPVAFVEEMAAAELALAERLAAELPLSGDALAAARRIQFVLVPLPAAGGDD
ncbi:MAG: hypothetical protein HMLKMBBP_03955 [Planctomycetes bacterium]|nr:hypothetical protein [Planctomycetota bacterium]